MIDPLDGNSILGDLPPETRNEYYSQLAEIGETQPETHTVLMAPWDKNRRLYEARATVIAYVGNDNQLMHASNIEAEEELINQFVDVTLDRFYVHRYPGSSKHKIQINFSLEHLVNLATSTGEEAFTTQDVLYGYIVEAVDGQAAPPTGAAIFRRLRIGNELQMKIATIHLADRTAEQIREVLESDVMKKGLTLLSTVNPAFPMINQMVLGATRLFLSRKRNKPIHEVPIGFLVNAATADPKLRQGSYVLIQGQSDWLDLANYCWSPERGRVEHKNRKEELALNHIIFSIRKSL